MAGAPRGISLRQIARQRRHRGAIRRHMAHRDQQRVILLPHRPQLQPHRQLARRIECHIGRFSDGVLQRGTFQRLRLHRQARLAGRQNPLRRLRLAHIDQRAQALMPLQQVGSRLPNRRHIQRPPQPQPNIHIESRPRARRSRRLEHRPLADPQRNSARPRAPNHRLLLAIGPRDQMRQPGDGGGLKHRRQR